jgi:L-fuconolactonase
MVIDSHHHFWNYNPREYGWISDAMSVLRRDFGPANLMSEISHVGIDAVVSVQARQTIKETLWLLEFANQNDFNRGVVGWVPLISPDVIQSLELYSKNPKLKSVRHVIQDESDDNYILRDDFKHGVSQLAALNLRYDILIFERHLPQTIQFVDRHPKQIFILDHIAKPRIREGVLDPWRKNLRELARRENVYVKLSGVVTEADWNNWTPGQLKPYFDATLEAFGPRRVMFGSDWPVCLVAATYERWVRCVRDYCAAFSPAEQERIFGGTAIEAYNL